MYTRQFLQANYNVVVDRCNFDVSQRATWVRLARQYGVPVDCIIFTADAEECGRRIMERVDHPTGVEGMQGQGILRRFVKTYQPPSSALNEGFGKIIYVDPSPNPVCTDERVDAVMAQLEQAPFVDYSGAANANPPQNQLKQQQPPKPQPSAASQTPVPAAPGASGHNATPGGPEAPIVLD
ncbi:hypothetical protein BC940DRAFT_231589 [Gongronella butleri]|nr:hypothetical protein BC940DRAFT_231589 [Gongronella butleri]